FGPLSASTIWKRVAEVYTRAGPEIWSAVPAAVTGNPFVGDTFAAALEAWLLDQGDAVDTREPLYVLELGAGTGMFSHPFVTAIARRRANGTFPHPRVVLVLCDQSEMRFDAWAEANVLAKHRQSGAIDFATLTIDGCGTFAPIVLEHSGASLAATVNPLVVVANYFFDSIPTDAFRVRDGRIFEARTRFVRVGDAPGFEGFENEEELVEASAAYYGDALLDAVLAGYARDFTEASVLMPVAAIRVVDALQALSGGRLLLLALDKGITGRPRMAGWFDQPFVAHSGVFSYLVNFDAMRRWFEARGGFALCSTKDDRALVAFAGTLPGPAPPSRHLQRYFIDQIDSVDAFNAFTSFAHGIHELPKLTKASGTGPLFDLLARMRGDPDAFAAIAHITADVIAGADDGVRSLALRLAEVAKENFYSPRFHNDVFYWSGRLHYALSDFAAAEREFGASVAAFGDRSHARFFLGAIAERRGFAETALDYYVGHRAVQHDCEVTRNAIRRMREKLSRGDKKPPPVTAI
ncbi:MAG TPA: hypothetical protein VFJ48_10900, partial [Casimicrobiaceae bacterium]|nr:hypothetical protein [Casimicrobiaceae bacterium]